MKNLFLSTGVMLLLALSFSTLEAQTQEFPDKTLSPEKYENAKNQWVKENPEAYQQMMPKGKQTTATKKSTTKNQQTKQISKTKTETKVSQPSVVKIKKADFEKMSLEKQAIVKQHPEMYKIVD